MAHKLTQSPYFFGVAFWLVFVIIFLVIAQAAFHLPILFTVVIAMNAASLAIYGVDKMFAITRVYRIPEKVLYLSAFLGGPIGAVIGMQIFRHKISKGSFKFYLALTVLAETAIIVFALQKLSLPL